MMIKFDAVQIPYSCKPVGRSSVTRPVTSRGVLPYPVYIICYPTMSYYIMISHHILLDHMLSQHVPNTIFTLLYEACDIGCICSRSKYFGFQANLRTFYIKLVFPII